MSLWHPRNTTAFPGCAKYSFKFMQGSAVVAGYISQKYYTKHTEAIHDAIKYGCSEWAKHKYRLLLIRRQEFLAKKIEQGAYIVTICVILDERIMELGSTYNYEVVFTE